jgi:hypothetical protein
MRIFEKVKRFKKEFFSINQTELAPFSKMLMTLFFLTSLWLIAEGIGSSIRQATPPEKKYGYECRYLASQKDFDLFDFSKRKYIFSDDSFGTDPACKRLLTAYKTITDDVHIQSEIDQLHLLQDRRNHIRREIDRINKNYPNMLLEKIGNQPKDKSILKTHADDARQKLSRLRAQESKLAEQIAKKRDIFNYPKLQEFVKLTDKLGDTILELYERERRFYRLKMSAQIFAFVIPIWLLFFALYRYLEKRKKYIFAKLSFYVASAAALYGLVELVSLVYSIIPKIFLAKVIAFFTSHNMVIVLNVLGILFFLGLFGLIIHKVQKNQEKNRARKDTRILNVKRGLCYNCASPRSDSDTCCAFCGVHLKTTCSACNAEIYHYTLYCTACGHALFEESTKSA